MAWNSQKDIKQLNKIQDYESREEIAFDFWNNDLPWTNKPAIPSTSITQTFISEPEISDESYSATWNWQTTSWPSKNAVYDEMETRAKKNNVLELDNTTAFTPNADYEPATKKYVDDNAWWWSVSDEAYDATTWNWVTDVAPSKNAIRDKLETINPWLVWTKEVDETDIGDWKTLVYASWSNKLVYVSVALAIITVFWWITYDWFVLSNWVITWTPT